MIFKKTNIADLFILEPRVFPDDRGYFFESFSKKAFENQGLNYHFVQDNESASVYGVIRGLHYQFGAYAQAKLVRVVEGEILDVVVDLRTDSKTYGKVFSIRLSSTNKKQLLIPRGFAHGFSVLSETAVFCYKCDNFYSKEHEGSIVYNDPTLNIDWEIEPDKALLSPKDLLNPKFGNHLK